MAEPRGLSDDPLGTRVLTSMTAPQCFGPDSNQRHVDFQSTALPTELPKHESLMICLEGMAYSYDRRPLKAREFRRKQRGKAKLRAKKYYRENRQAIRRRSRQWRRTHKSQIKRYEKRRKAQPSLYRLRNAQTREELNIELLDKALFEPGIDLTLLDYEIAFFDPSLDVPDIGFINWIDLDTTEVHTLFIRDTGERFYKSYDLYEWLDTVVLPFKQGEERILGALDRLHEEAAEEDDEDDD